MWSRSSYPARPSPQEYAPYVDVVSDVAAVELADRYPEVAVKDLDTHGSLLLADPGEAVQALLQLPCGGTVVPYPPRVAGIIVHHDAGCGDEPARQLLAIAVQYWRLGDYGSHAFGIGEHPYRI
jgi:hypothetical protein